MKSNKNADSIAGIIIAVFILSFILLGILSMIGYNNDVTAELESKYREFNVESNVKNLSKKLDIEKVENGEIFYINKTSEGKFDILTGSGNEQYKYVDNFLNNINPENYFGDKYELYFEKDFDILRTELKPSEIKNGVFNFDGFDMDGDGNIGSNYNQNQAINSWVDTLNGINAQSSNGPIFDNNSISNNSGAVFSGSNNLNIPESTEINNSNAQEKSFAIIFKTGENINNFQYIYKQGNNNSGYAIQIKNSRLYAGAWNNSWPSGNQYKISDVEINKNTIYTLIFTHDSSGLISENKIHFYLNGIKFSELNNIGIQSAHAGNISIGSSQGDSIDLSNNTSINSSNTYYFEGKIGEFSSWNNSLSQNEVNGINNYLENKWILNKKNIKYNGINTFFRKIN